MRFTAIKSNIHPYTSRMPIKLVKAIGLHDQFLAALNEDGRKVAGQFIHFILSSRAKSTETYSSLLRLENGMSKIKREDVEEIMARYRLSSLFLNPKKLMYLDGLFAVRFRPKIVCCVLVRAWQLGKEESRYGGAD